MRRFLLALAVLVTAAATPTLAGYIIVRVLLTGGGAGDTVPGGSGNYGPPDGGGRGGQPPAIGSGTGRGPVGGPPMPGGPPTPGGTPAPAGGDFDHTRSIVVVIPVEITGTRKQDLPRARLFPPEAKVPFPSDYNKEYEQLDFTYRGHRIAAPLFIDSTTIQVYDELLGVPGARQTQGTEVRAKHSAWAAKKDNAQLLYDALLLALQYGFVPQARDYAAELLEVAAAKKLTLPDPAARFVAAWGAMSKDVLGGAEQSPRAGDWQRRLNRYLRPSKVHHSGHFTLIAGDNFTAKIDLKKDTVDMLGGEVDRRLAQLNENFHAFFLWHATRGVVLKVPDQALLVALAADDRGVPALRAALDCLPGEDGFYAPEHELLVLSPRRLDSVGRTFLDQNGAVFKTGLVREQLLARQYRKPSNDPAAKNLFADDIAHAATLAAVEVLMREEFEVAAISREGTRQLLYATGLLPRHVALPDWVANGAVNFFARPRGPAYVTVGEDDKPVMHVALSTGYGTTNYVLHRYFRDLQAKKELPRLPGEDKDDSAKLLANVLADAYYAGLKNGEDPDPPSPRIVRKAPANPNPNPNGGAGGQPPFGQPGGPTGGPGLPAGDPDGRGGGRTSPGPVGGGSIGGTDPVALLRAKQQRLGIKANATSWALYYYLAREKPTELKEYLAELNRMPRDLPIDGATARDTFVRAFKLSSVPDGPADPKRFKAFADEWLEYMRSQPLIGHDVPLVLPKAPTTTTTPGGGPGGPPGRGGSPGADR